jgi:hypothetical protein
MSHFVIVFLSFFEALFLPNGKGDGEYIRSILDGTHKKSAFQKAMDFLMKKPNYWECILKRMEDNDNDVVARKIKRECLIKAPNKSEKDKSSFFGISNSNNCLVTHGKSSASNLAVKEIKYACKMLYPD